MASVRSSSSVNHSKSYSKSPRMSYHPIPPSHSTDNGTSGSKLPPTGPRAYKKPRLSEPQTSPHLRSNAPLPPQKSHNYSHNSNRGRPDSREYPPRRLSDARGKSNHLKMEVEEDHRARLPSPPYDRDRERGRERNRFGGERERDGHRAQPHRRNGNFNSNTNRGGPGRRPERSLPSNDSISGDRTLAERMGL